MNTIYRKSRVVKTYTLILIELIVVALSFIGAMFLRFGGITADGNGDTHVIFGIFLLLASLMYSMITDWNRDFFIRGYFRELVASLKYTIVITVVSVIFMYLRNDVEMLSRLVFGVFAVANLILTYLVHLGFKEYMLNAYKKSVNSDKLMVITTKERAKKVVKQIKSQHAWNYELTSVAIMDADMKGGSIEDIPVVAGASDLIEVATQNILDRVFISLPRTQISEVKDMIMDFEAMGILCHYHIDVDELSMEGKEAGDFAGFSVLSFSLQNMDYRRLLIKRAFDILGSIIGLLFTIILFPFIALAIKIESRGPVIFKQERIGKNGRHFLIYKFRSMYQDAEERKKELMDKNEMNGLMFKIGDDPRITKVGRFLRKTSLDEFPQFLNVLKGDMSLVGTRPPTVAEFEKYNVHYRRRLSITPGLTGLWQVSGRSDITDFDEVVRLDLEYIDRWSLALDAKLLLQTVGVVLFGRGSK
ncbi:MAG: sugar transferase [Lachnospiraceae bacterium]|nr:sugar transferase [Lachnospiraceae bacterium]